MAHLFAGSASSCLDRDARDTGFIRLLFARFESRRRRCRRHIQVAAQANIRSGLQQAVVCQYGLYLPRELQPHIVFGDANAELFGIRALGRQQRCTEFSIGIDLEVPHDARQVFCHGIRRQRRALYEIEPGVASDIKKGVIRKRAGVCGIDHVDQLRIDTVGQALCQPAVLVKCLPFELAIGLPDQGTGGHGQRQEKNRQQSLETAFIEAFNKSLGQHG